MAIIGYEYRIDGGSPVDVGLPDPLTFIVDGLESSTEYDFEVRGYDAEGNRTPWSNVATASTFGLTANAAFMCCTGACGLGVHDSHAGDISIDTVVTREGGTHSIRFESLGDTTIAAWNPSNLNVDGKIEDGFSARFYVNYESLPDADAMLCFVGNSPFINPTHVGIAYHAASGTLRLASFYFGTYVFAFESAGSGVISVDQWYQIDIRWWVDESDDVRCEAEVNEAAITSRTDGTLSNLDLRHPSIWSDHPNSTAATVFRIADFILSTAKDDFPIGPGHVRRWLPSADGNHRIDVTGDFKVGTTSTDIADSATTSYQLVDDTTMPEDNGTVTGDDFIRQAAAAGGSGTQYVEHTFANPDGYTPVAAPRLVQYLNVGHADGLDGTGSCRLVDNTTERTMTNFADVGTNYQPSYDAMPSNIATEGPWKITGIDGNFLLLKHRFGHSTGSGADISLDALMIEAEFAGDEA